MRFVAPKSEQTQAAALVFRARDLLVRQRTQVINALRGHLAEFGIVVAKGPAHVPQLVQVVENPDEPLLTTHQISWCAGSLCDWRDPPCLGRLAGGWDCNRGDRDRGGPRRTTAAAEQEAARRAGSAGGHGLGRARRQSDGVGRCLAARCRAARHALPRDQPPARQGSHRHRRGDSPVRPRGAGARQCTGAHACADHRQEPGQNNFECGTPASVNSKFSCPLCAERAPAGGGRLLWITLSRASDCAKYEITLDVALHFGSEGYSRTEKLNKSNDQVGRETLQLFKLSLGVLPPGALLRHQTRGMCGCRAVVQIASSLLPWFCWRMSG